MNLKKKIKKYKILIIINIIIILLIAIFPMKDTKSEFISGTSRVGITLEPNVIVSQEFTSKFDEIERVSLLMSTIDKNSNCTININIFNNKKEVIANKKIKNKNLKEVLSKNNASTDLVHYYLEKPIKDAKNKNFFVEVTTDCNNIVKLQYYELKDGEKCAIYNNQKTLKKLPIMYTTSAKTIYSFIYPIIILIISLIAILGGKNEKK